MPWFIYQVTNCLTNKRYIGKTSDVARRWYEHCYAAQHESDLFFHRAIRKYGADAFKIETLEEYDDENHALEREKQLIVELNTRDPLVGYNVAEGGSGGNTMTQQQLDSQYAISPDRYSEFKKLFFQGLTQKMLAQHFNVSSNAVLSCLQRLGITSFRARDKRVRIKRPKVIRVKKTSNKMTPEEYAEFRAAVARRANKARGTSEEIQIEIKRLYFDEGLTAKQVAERLQVTHGSVRSTISRAYSLMTLEERQQRGKNNGWTKEGDK